MSWREVGAARRRRCRNTNPLCSPEGPPRRQVAGSLFYGQLPRAGNPHFAARRHAGLSWPRDDRDASFVGQPPLAKPTGRVVPEASATLRLEPARSTSEALRAVSLPGCFVVSGRRSKRLQSHRWWSRQASLGTKYCVAPLHASMKARGSPGRADWALADGGTNRLPQPADLASGPPSRLLTSEALRAARASRSLVIRGVGSMKALANPVEPTGLRRSCHCIASMRHAGLSGPRRLGGSGGTQPQRLLRPSGRESLIVSSSENAGVPGFRSDQVMTWSRP